MYRQHLIGEKSNVQGFSNTRSDNVHSFWTWEDKGDCSFKEGEGCIPPPLQCVYNFIISYVTVIWVTVKCHKISKWFLSPAFTFFLHYYYHEYQQHIRNASLRTPAGWSNGPISRNETNNEFAMHWTVNFWNGTIGHYLMYNESSSHWSKKYNIHFIILQFYSHIFRVSGPCLQHSLILVQGGVPPPTHSTHSKCVTLVYMQYGLLPKLNAKMFIHFAELL